ncbi:protease [Idiomarina xiamenensis 10-D-4]|uniref:Protease n=1 Tax=Idiomarina xiamenensis 10-D-4 TaxID=740709 RepID=K2LB90_9GAMM|nr:protease [Idiomarina xiamenensis 10-D-4]
MLLDEDEHGSYIMNSKDLRAVDLVPELVNIGVHSLKIEGRTKSDYYVARTTQVYRQAIDDAMAGKPFDPALLAQLAGMANRGFTHGFLQRHSAQDLQNYQQSHSVGNERLVAQLDRASDSRGDYWLDVKNGFNSDDKLLLMTPQGNHTITAATMRNEHGERLLRAPGSGYRVQLTLPAAIHQTLRDSELSCCFIIQQTSANSDTPLLQESAP